MPRKKKEVTEPAPDGSEFFDQHGDVPQQATIVDGMAAEPEASKAPPASTITIRLDAAGRVDMAGMRQATTAKLQAALESTPSLFSKPMATEAVPDYLVSLPHQLIAAVKISFAGRTVPNDVAVSIFAFTPEKAAILGPPTKAVLADYLPKLGKHQNLAGLVAAMFVITSQEIAALRSYVAQMESRVNTSAPA